jgi:hypothetical protein
MLKFDLSEALKILYTRIEITMKARMVKKSGLSDDIYKSVNLPKTNYYI